MDKKQRIEDFAARAEADPDTRVLRDVAHRSLRTDRLRDLLQPV